jgi:hypothetical protein
MHFQVAPFSHAEFHDRFVRGDPQLIIAWRDVRKLKSTVLVRPCCTDDFLCRGGAQSYCEVVQGPASLHSDPRHVGFAAWVKLCLMEYRRLHLAEAMYRGDIQRHPADRRYAGILNLDLQFLRYKTADLETESVCSSGNLVDNELARCIGVSRQRQAGNLRSLRRRRVSPHLLYQ